MEEKYTFIRDYTEVQLLGKSDLGFWPDDLYDGSFNLIQNVTSQLLKLPHSVSDKGKENFEFLVLLFNDFAENNHGRIEAAVDYKQYDAYIEVYLPAVDFCRADTEAILKESCSRAFNIAFTNIDDIVMITVFVKYFECN